MHNSMGAGMFNYDKLDTLIDESGKTKSFLCRQMGKPVYYLRDVLKQRTAIPLELQEILARELGVTVAYLNDEEQTKKPATEVTGEGMDVIRDEIMPRVANLSQAEVIRLMGELAAFMQKREGKNE